MTREALVLDFQPRHCIQTGDLRAVEAVLRWPIRRVGGSNGLHHASGIDRGLIHTLSTMVLQAACSEAMAWPQSTLRVSVKLLGAHFSSEELCLQVGAVLAETGLPPERLELAIPEHLAFALDEDAASAFAALRDIGVNLLLDEFGHTIASLVVLRDLPLTALKFDRLMLRDIPADRDTLAMVRAVIGTAHAIGLSACADGIDFSDQRIMLHQLGLDEGQGMVFSQPLSAQEIRHYLRR